MVTRTEPKTWTRKKITKKKEKFNFKELLFKIKDNPKTSFIILLSVMLVFDYFIYTDVFHLNQADFFNYTYSNILSQQFFVIFILLPFILIGIIFSIFRIEYIILQKIDFKNYFIFRDNNIFVLITVGLISGAIAFYGEGLVFFLLDDAYLYLKKFNIQADAFTFFIFLNVLFFLVNIITLYLLVSVSSVLPMIFLKFQSIKQTTIFACILGSFIGLKLAIYPIIALIFPQYNFDSSQKLFILLNIIIFTVLAVLYISNKNINKNNSFFDVKKKEELQIINKLILVIILVLDATFVFYNIGKVYRSPYEDLLFWQKNIYNNSLSIFNLSLFMSPLRMSQFNDIKNLETMLQHEYFLDFIENKQIPQSNLADINTTLNHLIHKNGKKEKIFFLPNGDRKLLFIQDNNQTITILHVKDNNSSSAKLVDIGYIELKN